MDEEESKLRPDAEPPRKPRFLAVAPVPRQVERVEFSASEPQAASAGNRLRAPPMPRTPMPAPAAAFGRAPPAEVEASQPAPVEAPAPPPLAPAPPPAPIVLAPPPPPPLPQPAFVEAPSAAANERLEAALRSLQELGTRLYGEARADALEVGFLIARRILETEIRQSPEPLFQLVRSALQKVGEARPVTLRVHPEDALRLHAPHAGAPSLVEVHVLGDPSLQRGDVVIDAEFGSVDARLETRLAELHRSAVASLEEES